MGETAGARHTAFTPPSHGSASASACEARAWPTLSSALEFTARASSPPVAGQRIWAQVTPTPELAPLEQMLPRLQFGPDGATLDAEGLIWAADEARARCARVAAGVRSSIRSRPLRA